MEIGDKLVKDGQGITPKLWYEQECTMMEDEGQTFTWKSEEDGATKTLSFSENLYFGHFQSLKETSLTEEKKWQIGNIYAIVLKERQLTRRQRWLRIEHDLTTGNIEEANQ